MGLCESLDSLDPNYKKSVGDKSNEKLENNNNKNLGNNCTENLNYSIVGKDTDNNKKNSQNSNFQNINNNKNPTTNENSASEINNKFTNSQVGNNNNKVLNNIQEQEEIQKLKYEQIKKNDEIIRLKSQLALRSQKLQPYNNYQLQSRVNQLNAYINKNKELNNTIVAINNKNLQLQNQVNQLSTQINKNQELNNKIIAINNKNLQLQSQVNQLNAYINKNKELNNTIIAINNKNLLLQNQVNHLSTQINKNEELNNTIVAINNKNAQLNQEISQLKSTIENLKSLNSNEPILVGLDNIGATCYMNATLQSLSNTPKLTEYFLKKEQFDKTAIMSYEYYIVLKNLWDRKKHMKSYAPHSFKQVLSRENPLFEGVNANDSKDLINFLLEKFHKELNTINANNVENNIQITQQDQLDENKVLNLFLAEFNTKYHSIISDLFYGVMETKSKCQGCMYIKYNFQVYSFIEFPLEQVNKYYFNLGLKSNNNTTINPDVDLFECFNYYGKIDLMNGDNQMYCNICRRNCDAFYSTNLYSLPNNLIINLNRGRGAVYQCTVKFPEKLNLLNFVGYQQGNTYFELYAVISHIGPSSMSGHFVAYCKHKTDKKWYKFNDSFVEPCKQKEEFRNGMPYILFYQAL